MFRRNFTPHTYDLIERDLIAVNWTTMYKMNNCQDQADFFYDALCSSVNKHAPRYQLNLKENDKPWVTASFKNDVTMRNKAFTAGNLDLYRKLRNQVNRESQRLNISSIC